MPYIDIVVEVNFGRNYFVLADGASVVLPRYSVVVVGLKVRICVFASKIRKVNAVFGRCFYVNFGVNIVKFVVAFKFHQFGYPS